MICKLFKGMFKTGVVTTAVLGAVAGGALLLAGPNRARAVVHQFHDKVVTSIDNAIDDPVALRGQLQELEREYPKRISAVRGDLAELNEQVRQLQREKSISERVVALADRDLVELEDMVEAARTAHAERGAGARLASITFDDKVYSFQRAANKLNRIRTTRMAHASRASDAEHDLAYLNQQAERFGEMLTQLEAERAQFQTQIFQLARQVDSIERNDRLIDLLEKRERTIERCSNFDVSSLDQLMGKLSQIRTRQEAELDVLASSRKQVSYEDMARIQLDEEKVIGSPGIDALPQDEEERTYELVPAND
ncbi:MAG: hypothetical protein GY711_30295 [bacterium]|nr:hypothetical protein [bacterium]